MLFSVTRRETKSCWSGIAFGGYSMMRTTLSWAHSQGWDCPTVISLQQAVSLVGQSSWDIHWMMYICVFNCIMKHY